MSKPRKRPHSRPPHPANAHPADGFPPPAPAHPASARAGEGESPGGDRSARARPKPPPPAAPAAPRPLAPPPIPKRMGGATAAPAAVARDARRRRRRALAAVGLAVLAAAGLFLLGFISLAIPTAAMAPTLQGDGPQGAGDHILVSRWETWLGTPARFDVVVFRHPLDRSHSFVKRIVGLPNEEIALAGGDVWIRRPGEVGFRIARKPAAVQERLWIPVERTDLRDRPADWLLPAESQLLIGSAGGPVLLDPTDAPEQRAGVAYQRPVTDRFRGAGGDCEVADLRLRATVGFTRVGGACELLLHAGAESLTFRAVAGGKSVLRFADPARRASAEVAVRRDFGLNRDYRLELGRSDRSATAVVDGTVWARYEWGDEAGEEGLPEAAPPAACQLLAEAAPLKVAEVAIDRDVHYTAAGVLKPGEPLAIPAGCWFAVGDNARASKDSRSWRMAELRLADGRTLYADEDNLVRAGDVLRLRDLEGEEVEVPVRDVVEQSSSARPFVRAEDLLGRVWGVWWPPGRARWVR